jgi:hypothetical protein
MSVCVCVCVCACAKCATLYFSRSFFTVLIASHHATYSTAAYFGARRSLCYITSVACPTGTRASTCSRAHVHSCHTHAHAQASSFTNTRTHTFTDALSYSNSLTHVWLSACLNKVGVTQEEYADIVEQQLTELWTQYGDLAEIWFDGGFAVGGLQDKLLNLLNHTQPHASIFNGCGLR